ncbi:aminoethanethiol dioxygenase [Seminavis robusta]|uniref:Aminoethanethiol dioxygenase n=1 Tax=Seminavis robusta TaxID=568900 RepID=A0A9N8EKP5_9STRA|nr:aminoethanethiol dioxygenase [Seminavis robusta]|eukprot:Sro1366_g266650.1 aminoethanethiol dioxygenase (386) ;mRNA; r:7758-9072
MATTMDHQSVLTQRLHSSLLAIAAYKSRGGSMDESSGRHPSPNKRHSYDSSNPASDDEFHLTIPSILTQSDGGLSRMDQKLLGDCLQPVVKSLKALDAESLLGLERVQNGARLCDGVNVRPIHDEVYPRYESFGTMSCVRYIHITEVPEQYSIGIFVFPPFSRIPLHDHPEMCVLSRLLYGDLQCLSLDLPQDDESQPSTTQAGQPSGQQQPPPEQPQSVLRRPYETLKGRMFGNSAPGSSLPPGVPEGSRRAFKNSIRHLHAPEVCVLFPYKGNLHEFYAGPNGAAVLDILLPPYDVEHERDCTFYDILEDQVAAAPSPSQPLLVDVDPSAVVSPGARDVRQEREEQSEDRIPCWIVPTDQPHDFHCLSGKYQKLGTNVIALQD